MEVPAPWCRERDRLQRGESHQESGVHRAGSTLLGVTVKVLFKMLMTGRALGRDGDRLSIPSHAPRSGTAPPCLVPAPGAGHIAPCPPRGVLAEAGSVPGRWQGGQRAAGRPLSPCPLPEQDHPLGQAAHQEVGVEVTVHVHPPAQRVSEGPRAGGAQIQPADHLDLGGAVSPIAHYPHRSGHLPAAPRVRDAGRGVPTGPVPAGVCPAALPRCCGRCRPCRDPRKEPPQRCLWGEEEGQPHRGRGSSSSIPPHPTLTQPLSSMNTPHNQDPPHLLLFTQTSPETQRSPSSGIPS